MSSYFKFALFLWKLYASRKLELDFLEFELVGGN